MPSIKCIVFDADNTLYHTKKIASESDMAAMVVLGNAINKKPEDLYVEFTDIVQTIKSSSDPRLRHRKYSYKKLCEKYGKDMSEEMYAAFEKVVIDKIELVPMIREVLGRLLGKYDLYVATEDDRYMVEKKLEKLDLRKFFKGIISSTDTGIMKPSEKYYETVLGKFAPEEVVVVGDKYDKDLALPEEMHMKTFLIEQPEDLTKFEAFLKQMP